MASNEELERLRAEVKRRRKAVNDKVGRLRRRTGVDISGSAIDPRRDIKNVNRYNSRQLKSYLNQLNSFTDRKNTYSPSASGELISNARFKFYKQLEARYNAVGASEMRRVGKIKDPILNVSLDKIQETYHGNRPRASGEAVNRPYGLRNVELANLNGPAALEKLISNMQQKLSRNYLPEQLNKGRRNLIVMLEIMGDVNVKFNDGTPRPAIDIVNNLSDNQFDILWNYTNVAGVASFYASDRGNRNEEVEGSAAGDVGILLAWATTLPSKRGRR